MYRNWMLCKLYKKVKRIVKEFAKLNNRIIVGLIIHGEDRGL